MSSRESNSVRQVIEELLANDPVRDATKLARELNKSDGFVRDLLKGRKRSLGATAIAKIESIYGLPAGSIIGASPIRELQRVPIDSADDEADNSSTDNFTNLAIQGHNGRLGPGEILERDVIGGLGEGGDIETFTYEGESVDKVRALWRLPPEFIRYQLHAKQSELDFIPVDGDSMQPTLTPGDRVLVNRGHKTPSPDGLYAIHNGVGVVVKRLEIVYGSRPLQIRVISDNQAHGSYTLAATDIHIIGRVIVRVTQC